jgi:hypothetical protein
MMSSSTAAAAAAVDERGVPALAYYEFSKPLATSLADLAYHERSLHSMKLQVPDTLHSLAYTQCSLLQIYVFYFCNSLQA